MKRLLTYLTIIVLAASLAAGCGAKKKKQAEETVPVRVMKIELRDLARTLEYAGTVKGRDEAIVYPKVGGKIIEKVKEDGSPIKKGEVIAYIDRDEVGLKFEKAPIESPLTGVVGRVYVDIGVNVTPQTPIALIADMAGVEMDLDIPEKYLPKLAIGQRAIISVDAYPDEEFKGTVARVSPIVDIQTRAAPIQITIEDEKHLLQSGMFAKVRLLIEERKNIPVILREAVAGKDPDMFVFVISGDRASVKNVSLGIHEGPFYEVKQGLAGGELVVIMGQQRLRDGSLVAVEMEK